MKKEPGLFYRAVLIFGDAIAIILSFSFAYYYRVHIDSRPFFFESALWEFMLSVLMLLPIWIVILASLGLYSRHVLGRRILTGWRLLIGSVIAMMAIISYDFFFSALPGHSSLFPVKIIAVYAAIFCYLALTIERFIIGLGRVFFLRHNMGALRTLVVGNSDNTRQLLAGVTSESGFKLVGVVAKEKYIPEGNKIKVYEDTELAIKRLRPDAIIYTGAANIERMNKLAIDHHALFYYSPREDSIITLSRDVEFLAATPIIRIKTTPLNGGAIVYKRILDVILSLIGTIIALPIMIIIFIIQKIIDPHAPAIYKDTRLTRFNREFQLYKFRSIKSDYNGLTPEEAFAKMGKPELAEKYRKQGDYLKNDPRYTKFGRFLRSSSLDELPQLFNVLKGDISLVGPRALQPAELKNYGDRGIILSVKSGVTGLAQVSGRRNISFNERRAFDVYYVQNWTPALDFQIILRTIASVLGHEGAK